MGQKPSLSDLRGHQHKILKRIAQLHQVYGRRFHPIAEPKRSVTHRDHLLGEMEWMANDFDRERKLKVANTKRFARAALGIIKLKHEQATRKLEEEITHKKKLANRVAKIVAKY